MDEQPAENETERPPLPPHVRASLALFGEGVPDAVAASRVLVVGAGGIGCELLKNLVLAGFRDIETVDLDTIDVSNLNRQFLFRREHVGQGKAAVARGAVLRLAPGARVVAHHGNVKEFKPAFYERFNLVLNALDNLDARRHVNRLCHATSTLLVESGTQGYIGQVKPIRPGVTECFECTPQTAAKTYAVCTIRSTPDQPVHCVVWAKHVYAAVFGPRDDDNMLSDLKFDPRPCVGDAERAGAFAREVFDQLFDADIEASLRVADRWKKRAPPTPLRRVALEQEAAAAAAASAGGEESTTARQHRALSDAEQTAEFVCAVRDILTRRGAEVGGLVFDKDDADAMRFVSSAANLRMSAFGIPTQSAFEVKGVAGNIVHAIATTNAICAGGIVTEALKLLAGRGDECRMVWIKRGGPRVLQPMRLAQPNPACYVCGKAKLQLTLDTSRFTLAQLFDVVLRKGVGMNDPGVDVPGNYIGVREDHEPDYLARPLDAVMVRDGSILSVDDHSQNLECTILVRHSAALDDEEHPDGYVLSGAAAPRQSEGEGKGEGATVAAPEAVAAPAAAPQEEDGGGGSAPITIDDDSDDDVVVVAHGTKRGSAAPAEDATAPEDPAAKRQRRA